MSLETQSRIECPGAGWVPLAEWRVLFDASPLAIAYVTPDLRLSRVNGAFAALAGRMPSELIGLFCYEVLPEPRSAGRERVPPRPCSFCPLKECLRTGAVQRFERPFGERTLRAVMAPARDRWGRTLGVALMLADVTAERAARQQAEELRRLAEVGLMTSAVAHELKNPLTGVCGFTQLLRRRTDLPAEAKTHVEHVWREAQRCERTVASLLNFTRRRKAEHVAVDVNRVVREALDLVRDQFSTSGYRLCENYAPHALSAVCDPFELQQVVRNIVSNAFDAMTESQRGSVLTVSTSREEGSIVMAFENDGSSLADPAKLFRPFTSTKEVGRGAGLGLYISRDIVRRHGGDIQATNTPRGVLFRVQLPLASGPEATAPAPAAAGAAAPS